MSEHEHSQLTLFLVLVSVLLHLLLLGVASTLALLQNRSGIHQ
jgi:hypothetical protein